jgi:Protein of unknown function (DUF1579)
MQRVALVIFAAVLQSVMPSAIAGEPEAANARKFLQKQLGSWDVAITIHFGKAADSKPLESKGVATLQMGLGGAWLIETLKWEHAGERHEGIGMQTYNDEANKFVSTWVDSTIRCPIQMVGTLDPKGEVLTMTCDGPYWAGGPGELKSIVKWDDNDRFTTNVYSVTQLKDDDNIPDLVRKVEEELVMTLKYTRRHEK